MSDNNKQTDKAESELLRRAKDRAQQQFQSKEYHEAIKTIREFALLKQDINWASAIIIKSYIVMGEYRRALHETIKIGLSGLNKHKLDSSFMTAALSAARQYGASRAQAIIAGLKNVKREYIEYNIAEILKDFRSDMRKICYGKDENSSHDRLYDRGMVQADGLFLDKIYNLIDSSVDRVFRDIALSCDNEGDFSNAEIAWLVAFNWTQGRESSRRLDVARLRNGAFAQWLSTANKAQRVFIMGCGRSGTTLLYAMMGCFHDVELSGKEVPVSHFMRLPDLKKNQILKRTGDCYQFVELVPKQVNLVYVIRHPFDVLVSQLQNRQYAISPERWFDEIQAFRQLDDKAQRQVYIVKYEDLVCYPDAIQEYLICALGFKHHTKFSQFQNSTPWLEEDMVKAMHGLRPPDLSSIGRWRESSENLGLIRGVLSNPDWRECIEWALRRFGYEQTASLPLLTSEQLLSDGQTQEIEAYLTADDAEHAEQCFNDMLPTGVSCFSDAVLAARIADEKGSASQRIRRWKIARAFNRRSFLALDRLAVALSDDGNWREVKEIAERLGDVLPAASEYWSLIVREAMRPNLVRGEDWKRLFEQRREMRALAKAFQSFTAKRRLRQALQVFRQIFQLDPTYVDSDSFERLCNVLADKNKKITIKRLVGFYLQQRGVASSVFLVRDVDRVDIVNCLGEVAGSDKLRTIEPGSEGDFEAIEDHFRREVEKGTLVLNCIPGLGCRVKEIGRNHGAFVIDCSPLIVGKFS